MPNKYLLYIDIATCVNDSQEQFEYNDLRRTQIIDGVKKILEYDFASKGCDVLITDNTCDELIPELKDALPTGAIVRCYNNNTVGCINKGAGLVQKWQHNSALIEQYDYIIHIEGRLTLVDHSFFDIFFKEPGTYFRYGDPVDSSNHSHFFTGLFSTKSKDILDFCSLYPPERLIREWLSIEYPIKDYFINRGDIHIIDELRVMWFPSKSNSVYIL